MEGLEGHRVLWGWKCPVDILKTLQRTYLVGYIDTKFCTHMKEIRRRP